MTQKRERHGMSNTRLYRIWHGMKQRIAGNAVRDYSHLTMDPNWQTFIVFYEWAMGNGYSDNLSIDRIDNNKGYWPDNCRWATDSQQQSNKSSNIILTAFGETKTVTQWSEDERCVVNYTTLEQRIRVLGLDPLTAITTPKRKNQFG